MKNPVTEQLLGTLRAQAKSPPDTRELEFLRDYYHRLSQQDFTRRKAQALRDAALRHQRLGQTRRPGATLIEMYNPAGARKKLAAEPDPTIINIITDDKAFTLDSLTILLNSMRRAPRRIIHPTFQVTRDARHRRLRMTRRGGNTLARAGAVESYIQFVIDFVPVGEHKNMIRALRTVLADIEMVVTDWDAMRARTIALAKTMRGDEDRALLEWMENHNFALLGCADLLVRPAAGKPRVLIDGESARGLLRAAHQSDPAAATALLPAVYPQAPALIFTKSRRRSTIHRANYHDCIVINHAAHGGARPRRISCILGFFSDAAASLPAHMIPHVRRKVEFVINQSTLRPGGHAYKKLRSILENLPREKLFAMDARALYRLCMTILNHLERRVTRLHLHRDRCGHFYSCLVYVPRDAFNSDLRMRIQQFLGAQLNAAETSFNVYFSNSILTRIHYLIHCKTRARMRVTAAQLEREIQAMARDWNEQLYEEIRGRAGYERAEQTLTRYRDAFPPSYQAEFSIAQAARDLARLEQLGRGEIHAALAPRPPGDDECAASFKLYAHDDIALSDAVPILEHLGVRALGARPYRIGRRGQTARWIYDFHIARKDGRAFQIGACAKNFQAAFAQAWHGRIENDGFNQLTILADLNWREINLLRAYYRYLKQIQPLYGEPYIIDALAKNPKLAASSVRFFHARFDPARRGEDGAALQARIARQLERVATFDEDRIFQMLLGAMRATVRTNYFQTRAGEGKPGQSKPYLALKLDSRAVPHMPEPIPRFEIFVYSPRVEGVHLRGGKIARGGLRWSERAEDFRTEVLGLVKAQRVKNAIIVPVGSKGGFIAKRADTCAREEQRREVVACYQTFIRGLLDVTDNFDGRRIIPPADTTRWDDDDPYLVVAADKGTATFSDLANEISAEYGFWLGDAFASGGSAGFDHKKMGITARGAWESVKRHFRELNKDIQSADFTVVGIGDMGGDVFGNGMLLSEHIRLLAAFNHQHIFIDPKPDAARSFAERKRLFRAPNSSWDHYDRKLISRGGGVFARSAKSIKLSPAAKKALGATKNQYAPNDLIRLILKSEVELLFNGGIGTYVKASHETDADARDKNNDGVRISADELRCRVVAEGGNLGLTQLARVEYCMRGGRCYTDAIDNSAGVDTSDHEVNIKILLNIGLRARTLSPRQRNALLAKTQRAVGALVLQNNYAQTQALSLEARMSAARMPQQGRALDALAARGLLKRKLEFLPSRAEFAARAEQRKWLTRPELAVLLSYSKMDLYQTLLDSTVPEDAYLTRELDAYFPRALTKQYPDWARAHRLRREIIATQITNQLIGAMGPSFHLNLAETGACEVAEIARAYVAARDILGAVKMRAAVESLDNKISADAQLDMLAQITATMRSCIIQLIQNQPTPLDIQQLVDAYRPGCARLNAAWQKDAGAPTSLTAQIAALPRLAYAVDIVDIARRNKRGLQAAARAYFQIREILGLHWLEQSMESMAVDNIWRERARYGLGHDLRARHAAITGKVLAASGGVATAVARWRDANLSRIQTIEKMISAVRAEPNPDFAMPTVILGELAGLH